MRFECGWCNVRPKNRGNARARASVVKCETKSRGPFTKALKRSADRKTEASGAGTVRT